MQEHEATIEEVNSRNYVGLLAESRDILSSPQSETSDSHSDTDGDP